MTTEQYDDAMFDFSRGEFGSAITKLKTVLAVEPEHFDAQLALGMAYEDTIRVAELKVRRSRFERVRAEVVHRDGDVIDLGEERIDLV